jgi:hypothetical protein
MVTRNVLVLLAIIGLLVGVCSGCGKKEEEAAVSAANKGPAVPVKKNEKGVTVDPITGKEDAAINAPPPKAD